MRVALFVCVTAASGAVAMGQTAPDYGFQWRTVGDPGNPDASPDEYFHLQAGVGPVGRVDYLYRLTRTEVTNTQWIEFVNAYVAVRPEVWADPGFHGRDVYFEGTTPGTFNWYTTPWGTNAAAQMSWLYAARYCNWLHNGKVSEAWAFDSGAYDMSTYHETPNGWVGQATRSPGARFWIPSNDEWTKGMHWDPNKNGAGNGGYWLYPHSSDVPAVTGAPGAPGAQTGAGNWDWDFLYMPVGQYPNAQSPWGLLDGSGGASEYFEDIGAMHGSYTRSGFQWTLDRLDFNTAHPPVYTVGGLRIASAIPSPAVPTVVAVAVLGGALRRRR